MQHQPHLDAARWADAQKRVQIQRAGEARAALERLDAARRTRVGACLAALAIVLVAVAAIWSAS